MKNLFLAGVLIFASPLAFAENLNLTKTYLIDQYHGSIGPGAAKSLAKQSAKSEILRYCEENSGLPTSAAVVRSSSCETDTYSVSCSVTVSVTCFFRP